MRNLCEAKQVNEVAMPMIATGLDKLDWSIIGHIIDEVFKDSGIKITVIKYQGGNFNRPRSKRHSNSNNNDNQYDESKTEEEQN
jgi:hypothetical protein